MDWLFPSGFKYPPNFHIPSPTGEEIFRIGPVGYTNAHLTMALVIVLLGTIAILATRDLRERPGGLQNFVELLVQGLVDFVESIGGKRALTYLPLFGTLFLFIVVSKPEPSRISVPARPWSLPASSAGNVGRGSSGM